MQPVLREHFSTRLSPNSQLRPLSSPNSSWPITLMVRASATTYGIAGDAYSRLLLDDGDMVIYAITTDFLYPKGRLLAPGDMVKLKLYRKRGHFWELRRRKDSTDDGTDPTPMSEDELEQEGHFAFETIDGSFKEVQHACKGCKEGSIILDCIIQIKAFDVWDYQKGSWRDGLAMRGSPHLTQFGVSALWDENPWEGLGHYKGAKLPSNSTNVATPSTTGLQTPATTAPAPPSPNTSGTTNISPANVASSCTTYTPPSPPTSPRSAAISAHTGVVPTGNRPAVNPEVSQPSPSAEQTHGVGQNKPAEDGKNDWEEEDNWAEQVFFNATEKAQLAQDRTQDKDVPPPLETEPVPQASSTKIGKEGEMTDLWNEEKIWAEEAEFSAEERAQLAKECKPVNDLESIEQPALEKQTPAKAVRVPKTPKRPLQQVPTESPPRVIRSATKKASPASKTPKLSGTQKMFAVAVVIYQKRPLELGPGSRERISKKRKADIQVGEREVLQPTDSDLTDGTNTKEPCAGLPAPVTMPLPKLKPGVVSSPPPRHSMATETSKEPEELSAPADYQTYDLPAGKHNEKHSTSDSISAPQTSLDTPPALSLPRSADSQPATKRTVSRESSTGRNNPPYKRPTISANTAASTSIAPTLTPAPSTISATPSLTKQRSNPPAFFHLDSTFTQPNPVQPVPASKAPASPIANTTTPLFKNARDLISTASTQGRPLASARQKYLTPKTDSVKSASPPPASNVSPSTAPRAADAFGMLEYTTLKEMQSLPDRTTINLVAVVRYVEENVTFRPKSKEKFKRVVHLVDGSMDSEMCGKLSEGMGETVLSVWIDPHKFQPKPGQILAMRGLTVYYYKDEKTLNAWASNVEKQVFPLPQWYLTGPNIPQVQAVRNAAWYKNYLRRLEGLQQLMPSSATAPADKASVE